MINVQLCCNDDNGIFTGRAVRVDFGDYELTCEDTLWPPRGVAVAFRESGARNNRPAVCFGRDIWRPCNGLEGFGGNIFWRNLRMHGVDVIGLMNYLMQLKYWHATEGECYLYDKFNAKQRIVPAEFFASRERT
jgi:hypothetical protein